jgi:hypothetical protein
MGSGFNPLMLAEVGDLEEEEDAYACRLRRVVAGNE